LGGGIVYEYSVKRRVGEEESGRGGEWERKRRRRRRRRRRSTRERESRHLCNRAAEEMPRIVVQKFRYARSVGFGYGDMRVDEAVGELADAGIGRGAVHEAVLGL
jgi:hypothetical protein